LADGLHRLAHQHAIHDYFIAGSKIAQRKLLLGGNGAHKLVGGTAKFDLLTRLQVHQGDKDIVMWVQLQNSGSGRDSRHVSPSVDCPIMRQKPFALWRLGLDVPH
jgi:hypothetical protein